MLSVQGKFLDWKILDFIRLILLALLVFSVVAWASVVCKLRLLRNRCRDPGRIYVKMPIRHIFSPFFFFFFFFFFYFLIFKTRYQVKAQTSESLLMFALTVTV